MSATAPTDERLAARAGTGDREAFVELVDRYAARLFGFLRPMTPPGRETADLVQDVWMKVWRALPRWKDGHFRGWLFAVARNAAADAVKSRPLPQSGDAVLLTVADPEAPATEPERVVKLRRCLDLLKDRKPEFHEAVVRQMADATLEEIAATQRVPLGTAKSRIGRGKAALRECVGEDEP